MSETALPWWRRTRPCPHCGAFCDISTRMNGDRVWCVGCDRWFAVVIRDGNTILVKAAPPVELHFIEKQNEDRR